MIFAGEILLESIVIDFVSIFELSIIFRILLNGVIGQMNIQITLALLIAVELKAAGSDVSFTIPVGLYGLVLE